MFSPHSLEFFIHVFLTGHPRGILASWAAFLTHWMDYKEVLSKSCSQSLQFACSFCSVFADKPDWCCFKVIGSVNADKAGPSEPGGFIGRHIAVLQRWSDSSITPADTFALEWWWTRLNLTLTMAILLLSLRSCQYQFAWQEIINWASSVRRASHRGLGSWHQHDL